MSLPAPIASVSAQLAAVPGAVAVVLGGSRATGTHRPDSDWDLGLYYRSSQRSLDPADVRRLGYEGEVSELGEWGPIMHGGAWLTVEGVPVDVLFRDLDVIEHWVREAGEGRFEILAQNGYLVGAPTYVPAGELAVCRSISGDVPHPVFTDALAVAAERRWEGRAAVALMFAAIHAAADDAVACAGMLSSAVLCAAHARLACRREWVLNEKRLVERAGLHATQDVLAAPNPTDRVNAISEILGIEPLAAR